MIVMAKLPQIQLQSTLVKNKAVAGEKFNQKGSLQIAPRDDAAKSLPANIILILDCSGSMEGHPMDLLNAAIDKVSQKMRPTDVLSIVAFGADAKIIIQEFSKDKIFQGIPQLITMGNTNYFGAFEKTIDLVKNKNTTRKLKGDDVHAVAKTALFLSDGQPNDPRPYEQLVKEFMNSGFSLHAMGLGGSVDPVKLQEIVEIAGGIYFHADDEEELEKGLQEMLGFSQNLVYSLPKLEITVFPGVVLYNLNLVAPPRELESLLEEGNHEVNLPDIQSGADLQLVFDIAVETPHEEGEYQDLVEWNMANAQSETTRIQWVNMQTVLLAPVSTRPVVLTKIFEGLDAVKNGNTMLSTRIAESLAKIPNNPLAESGATLVTDVSNSGQSQGKLLSTLSKTTTKRDGLKTK